MAKKSIIAGEYIIEIADNGHVDVMRIHSNAKGALREIAAEKNFPYEASWTTREFGRRLLKEFGDGETAQFGDITITKLESGTIEVCQTCENVKAALRSISEKIGFAYDEKWNTQFLGSKLTDYLTEHKAESDKVLKIPNRKKAAEDVQEECSSKENASECTILFTEIPYDKKELLRHLEMDPDDESDYITNNMIRLINKANDDDCWTKVSKIDTSVDGLYVTDIDCYEFTVVLNGEVVFGWS